MGSRARAVPPLPSRSPCPVSTESSHVLPSSEQRLRAYASVLLRHRVVIAGVALVVIAVGLVPSLLADPTYEATARIRVRAETVGSPFAETDAPNEQTRSRQLVTDVEIIESPRMRGLVLEALAGEAEPGAVRAELIGFSEVIDISARAETPQGAALVADTYAEVFVEQRRQEAVDALVTQAGELRQRSEQASAEIAEVDRGLADPATDPVTADNLRVRRASLATQVLDFSARADELDVEAALRRGGTEIVGQAVADPDPVSPQPLRSGITAAVLGLLAGIAAAVVLDIVQDRTASGEDLALIDASVPLLTSIPHLGTAPARPEELEPAGREAFRYLRTSLRFRSIDQPVRSVLVTSAVGEEGKTTTAVNLAVALAESGSRVVLVDADLRKPSVHRWFGLLDDVGLSTVLAGESAFAEAVHYVEPNLAVLPSGPPSPAANELLGRPAFERLVESTAQQCDFVVIDAPPVLPVADALVAARAVDGVVVVARVGQVRRREVRTLLRRLRDARIPVLGFAANDAQVEAPYGEYVEAGR